MPVITSLRGAMRDANRVNVFLDGKFSFSLTISELADAKLSQGQTLSDIEVEKLKSQSGTGKLYQQTLEYCFSRPHSKKEVIDFLKRKRQRRELAMLRKLSRSAKPPGKRTKKSAKLILLKTILMNIAAPPKPISRQSPQTASRMI